MSQRSLKEALPPLRPGESFSHEVLRDEEGEAYGVMLKFQGYGFKVEEIVSIEEAYYAKFDLLRTRAKALLEKLRENKK